MVAMAELLTARLVLRPLEQADAPAIQAQFPVWEVVRYLAPEVPWPYPADGAQTYLRDHALPAMRAGREWHWSIRRRAAPGLLIGVVSLMDKPGDHRAFWLAPAWQGQGLMREAAAAVTEFWFSGLGREVLEVQKAAANAPSRRLSERGGMELVGRGMRDFVGGRLPAESWRLTRAAWAAREGANNT